MTGEQKVVTGTSQRIGAGIAKSFRDRGGAVVASSRSIKPGTDEGVAAA